MNLLSIVKKHFVGEKFIEIKEFNNHMSHTRVFINKDCDDLEMFKETFDRESIYIDNFICLIQDTIGDEITKEDFDFFIGRYTELMFDCLYNTINAFKDITFTEKDGDFYFHKIKSEIIDIRNERELF